MSTIRVRFVGPDGTATEVADAQVGHTLMEVAKVYGIEGILGDCGGGCACATCHVYVDNDWQDKVGPADEIEGEMLDMVSYAVRTGSRLACQITLREELDGLDVTVAPDA